MTSYRLDIEGLRAIAVISVILFHCDLFPNGYLGVDIFFVISGFLITGIIYREKLSNNLSLPNFYERRFRRIVPLVSILTSIVLAFGFFTMLPTDLESLAKSVIATNFFANNISESFLNKSYWDILTEYKPLMHTWSLGVEEQFYIFYPLIFTLFKGDHYRRILFLLLTLTLLSLFVFFFIESTESYKFYWLPFRFFELSLGGLVALLFKGDLRAKWGFRHLHFLNLTILLLTLLIGENYFSNNLILVVVVLLTCGLLITADSKDFSYKILLGNPVLVFIGKISFSLYLWHQIIIAFSLNNFGHYNPIIIVLLSFVLSAFTYHFIENVFRDRLKWKFKYLLFLFSGLIFLTTFFSFSIISNNGVLKDYNSLEIYKKDSDIGIGKLYQYNHKPFKLNKPFQDSLQTKVFVQGYSFARDWCNTLLESKYKEYIDIYYTKEIPTQIDILDDADIVFISYKVYLEQPLFVENLEKKKTNYFVIGIKNFGEHSGQFFNKRKNKCSTISTEISPEYWNTNKALSKDLGSRYIDFLSLLKDEQNRIRVFTDDCKFISFDGGHLTPAGAKYFAKILDDNKQIERSFGIN